MDSHWSQLLSIGAICGFLLQMSQGFYYTVSGVVVAGLYFLRQWSQGSKCSCTARLDGKTVVITGGNAGIGKETARAMSKRGARVIIGSRNLEKSIQVAQEIQGETGNEVIALSLDLAEFASVRKFAEQVLNITNEIHVLVNNAGIMFIPEERTVDGNEKQIQVNHLGHFLLTGLLLPALLEGKPSRIINLSSLAHTWVKELDASDLNLEREGYGKVKAYAKSKLANILFTRELNVRYRDLQVFAFAVHPGTVSSEISSHIEAWFPSWFNATIGELIKTVFLKTAENGAQTTLHCALVPEADLLSGSYFADCSRIKPSNAANDGSAQKQLWDKSQDIVGFVYVDPEDVPRDYMTIPANAPVMKILQSLEEISDDPQATQQANMELVHKAGFIVTEPVTEPVNVHSIPLSEAAAKAAAAAVIDQPLEDEKKESSSSSSSSDGSDNEVEKIIEIHQGLSANIKVKFEKVEDVEVEQDEEMVKKEPAGSDNDNEEEAKVEPEPDMIEIQEGKFEKIEDVVAEQDEEMVEKEASSSSSSSSGSDNEDANVEIESEMKESVAENQPKNEETINISSSESESEPEVPEKVIEKTIELSDSEEDETDLLTNIKSFEKSNLKPVETEVRDLMPDAKVVAEEKESIANETEQNKEIFGKVTEELLQVNVDNLKPTQVKESSNLPDKYDFQREKLDENLSADLLNFDSTSLKNVATYESSSIEVFKRQESIKKNIENFDAAQLKPAETSEKSLLPSQTDIEDEKAFNEIELQATKETFSNSVIEELESFDNNLLKHVDQNEEDNDVLKEAYMQEKTRQKLLEEVSTFKLDENLAHVKTNEPMDPLELVKAEMSRNAAMENVANFDKTSLKSTIVEEKIVLPDASTISMEKKTEEIQQVLRDVSTFEPSTLKSTDTQEKNPLPTVADINRERVQRELLTNIEEFDSNHLNKVALEEKDALMDMSDNEPAKPALERAESNSSSSSSGSSQPTTSSGGSSWEKVEND